MRGEIDQAQESLNIYQAMESAVHRCKKYYQHSVDHLAKTQGKVERAKADGPLNPKLSGVSEVKRPRGVWRGWSLKPKAPSSPLPSCAHFSPPLAGDQSEAGTGANGISQ